MTSARTRLFSSCAHPRTETSCCLPMSRPARRSSRRWSRTGQEVPENAVWIDLVNPTRRRGQARRAPGRRRDPHARGNAGDRAVQPALCGERRALHDGDADVPVGYAGPEDHAGDLHSRRPSPDHGALRRSEALRGRAPQAHPLLPGLGVRRDRLHRSARCRDRPLRRYPGARRRRDRPGVAQHLRARARRARRNSTPSSCRPSAARASSHPRCAKAWSRSGAC